MAIIIPEDLKGQKIALQKLKNLPLDNHRQALDVLMEIPVGYFPLMTLQELVVKTHTIHRDGWEVAERALKKVLPAGFELGRIEGAWKEYEARGYSLSELYEVGNTDYKLWVPPVFLGNSKILTPVRDIGFSKTVRAEDLFRGMHFIGQALFLRPKVCVTGFGDKALGAAKEELQQIGLDYGIIQKGWTYVTNADPQVTKQRLEDLFSARAGQEPKPEWLTEQWVAAQIPPEARAVVGMEMISQIAQDPLLTDTSRIIADQINEYIAEIFNNVASIAAADSYQLPPVTVKWLQGYIPDHRRQFTSDELLEKVVASARVQEIVNNIEGTARSRVAELALQKAEAAVTVLKLRCQPNA